ncbi:MAG: hypothetical protein RXR43_06130 [Sulfolobus sp.]
MLKIIIGQNSELNISNDVIEFLREHNILFVLEYDLLYDNLAELEYEGRKIIISPFDDIKSAIIKIIKGDEGGKRVDIAIPNVKWDRILSSGALI